MNKGFDQVAAFQKLWTDSFANMASVLDLRHGSSEVLQLCRSALIS